MQINGLTELIAHIGYPTHTFKAPMIYNPYFSQAKVNAVVVPMGCKPEDFSGFLRSLFKLSNIRGALITMPHKVSVLELLDELSPTAKIAGACNAVKLGSKGQLVGDMFDGDGFVRGIKRKGFVVQNAKALVVGCGGVGSAIAASLAKAGLAQLNLFDLNTESVNQLAKRLRIYYPQLNIVLGSNDPTAMQLVVNATPLGMNLGDALPIDPSKLSQNTFVGEVVMRAETTAFLAAAQAKGCPTQVGTDMLYEQIPAYLEFFGLPSTSAENLRSVADLKY